MIVYDISTYKIRQMIIGEGHNFSDIAYSCLQGSKNQTNIFIRLHLIVILCELR